MKFTNTTEITGPEPVREDTVDKNPAPLDLSRWTRWLPPTSFVAPTIIRPPMPAAVTKTISNETLLALLRERLK